MLEFINLNSFIFLQMIEFVYLFVLKFESE